MKRTWEKVLAWIGNVILILASILISLFSFTGFARKYLEKDEIKVIFDDSIKNAVATNPAFEGQQIPTVDQLTEILLQFLPVYSIIIIVITLVAILATLLMKKRILSGILFLFVAIASALLTFSLLWFLGIVYLTVSVMLFVRKEPTKSNDSLDSDNNSVDEIKYI